MAGTVTGKRNNPEQADRIKKLQEDINNLCGDQAIFGASPDLPADTQETDLEDIRAFEAVGKGISLFEGLQQHGIDLPHPDKLNEMQSRKKVLEILNSLSDLRIFLIGIEEMSGRKLYRLLWEQTLWEGCYVRKRNPNAVTLIDVSRKAAQSKMRQFLDGIMKKESVH
ncbi:MAG: hypothetical protein JXA73_14265 [Acidobacteria bacterium]|nr:hypothetical protein [Acidobacteriota bacterium]